MYCELWIKGWFEQGQRVILEVPGTLPRYGTFVEDLDFDNMIKVGLDLELQPNRKIKKLTSKDKCAYLACSSDVVIDPLSFQERMKAKFSKQEFKEIKQRLQPHLFEEEVALPDLKKRDWEIPNWVRYTILCLGVVLIAYERLWGNPGGHVSLLGIVVLSVALLIFPLDKEQEFNE